MSDVLCVDDDAASADAVAEMLREFGHQVCTAAGVEAAVSAMEGRTFDAVIAALPLSAAAVAGEPGPLDGLATLQSRANGAPFLVTVRHADPSDGVEALERGVLDYLTRPVRREALRLATSHALEVGRLRRENEDMRREFVVPAPACEIVGCSEAVRKVLTTIAAVAPTRAAVLLEGESGTGKELFARAIHEGGARRDHPLVSVRCAALPEGLVESTLFGHEGGAFTHGAEPTAGAFERADGGTLLLDEISEMRLDVQARLLRVLQEQEFERVGGSEPVRVDVRLVATTNRDLRAEVDAGSFRRDLYYRISVVPIHVPALRERRADVPLLVAHFVRRVARQLGMPAPPLPDDVVRELTQRPWPGNVRELESVVERAVVLSRGRALRLEMFEPQPELQQPEAEAVEDLPLNLREVESRMIERALRQTGGNRTHAARLLGISDRTLRSRLNATRRD